ncbi:tRNA dihydrouridine synthase [Patescibacteria group bacterium]
MKNFWEKLRKPIIALAPMAGITDAAFRIICKDFGADVIYTEFASTDALVHESKKTFEMLSFDPKEQPVVCQIFGKDPEMYYKSAQVVERLGFSGIDINFGCPAYKVVKHGGGVSLMRDPKKAAELVQATCEGAKNIPVSLKLRASICQKGADPKDPANHVTALDMIEAVKHLPVAAVMVHGRSYEKPFDGEPNTNMIKEVKKAFGGITIANGGVYTPENAKKLLEETEADGIGLARGVRGSPWLFKQVKDYFETGSYKEFSWEDKKTFAIKHAKAALKAKGDWGIIEMRKHLAWYVHGVPGASMLRAKLVRVNTLEDIESILNK